MMDDKRDQAVAAQYETLPYPSRDPRDETRRLVIGSPSHLAEIEHYLFAGRIPRDRPFRALVAGGGTGDATIMLAQQAKDAGLAAEIIYLDQSAASRGVAEARAATRGLDTIRFLSGSLLALEALGLGFFDYIDCCGVLHHLEDPAAGLASLARALAPADETPTARLDVAKRVMRHLPETAWLRRNGFLDDHVNGGDAGLYDVLLNPRDRAFTVRELHALLAAEGLEVACWVEPTRYDPIPLLPDPRLRARVEPLDPIDRAALAETLAGNVSAHIVYCVRRDAQLERADPMAPDAVPVLRRTQ